MNPTSSTGWRRLAAALGLVAVLGAAATSLAPAPAHGQDDATVREEDPSASRAAAFRAVEGQAQDNVPGGGLLVAAYAVVWLLVFGYVVRLARLQAKNASDLDRLLRAVDRGRSGGSGDD